MFDLPVIRTAYMPADRSTDLHFDEDVLPSMTQQQFADECDVNRIVRSNAFIPADPAQMRFADVSEVMGYEDALMLVKKAQESFSVLPAELRARFDNDPSNFVDFLADPANEQEAQELGLIAKPSEVAPEGEKPLATPPEEAVA